MAASLKTTRKWINHHIVTDDGQRGIVHAVEEIQNIITLYVTIANTYSIRTDSNHAHIA